MTEVYPNLKHTVVDFHTCLAVSNQKQFTITMLLGFLYLLKEKNKGWDMVTKLSKGHSNTIWKVLRCSKQACY